MAYDLSSLLAGGAASRPDSLSGLTPEMRAFIENMMSAAPPEIAKELSIISAYRSPEVQAQLWKNALRKYGSESAARKWVAPPGRSQHGFGKAIDWSYASGGARDWVRENAARFGGAFPLANEPWHMELAGARGGGGGVVPTTGLTLNTSNVPSLTPSSTPALSPSVSSPSAPSAPGAIGGNPLSMIAKALGGRERARESEVSQLTPTSIGTETNTVLPSMAANMMAMLMADRRRRYEVV